MATLAELYTDLVKFGYSDSHEISQEYSLHCHNYYEIYYFIEGDVDYLVEGRHYKPAPHSLLLLSPNVFHGVKVNNLKSYKRFALHFLPDIISLERRQLLLSAFASMEKHAGKEIYYQNPQDYRIYNFFMSIVDCSLLPNDILQLLLPIQIEALLSQITIMSHWGEGNVKTGNTTDTVTNIITYLNKHLSENINLDKISEEFFISKHHLNKVFKKATGTTVVDYLLYKRVIYGQQLLINGHSASLAATESGFHDYSSFYRAYCKITGHSPLKDRGVLPKFI